MKFRKWDLVVNCPMNGQIRFKKAYFLRYLNDIRSNGLNGSERLRAESENVQILSRKMTIFNFKENLKS